MANRYWVGGTAAWDAANVWSTTSGGAGGASNPTSSDDVFVDQNGPYTIQAASGSSVCRSISVTGSSVTLSAFVQFYGDFNTVASTTINAGNVFPLGSGVITLNGATCSSNFWFLSGTPSYTLGSNFVTTGALQPDNGTLTTSNYAVTVGNFFKSGGSPSTTLNLGTSVLTATSNGNSIQLNATITVTYSTGAALVFTGSGNVSFVGGGKSYPPLRFNNSGSAEITGSNTFDDISSTTTTAKTITFPAGGTTTFVAFNLRGTAGNLYTLNSSSSPTRANIKKPTAWYMGANSVNLSNNAGLTFLDGNGIDYLSVSNINGLADNTANGFLVFF
jgi:hypothetical protein